MAEDKQYCARCGASDYFEIMKLLRSYEEEGVKQYVYEIVCQQCGRPEEYVTDNPSALPERVNIREELLSGPTGFDPTISAESDLVGFSPDKVKDRLATGRTE